MAQWKDYGDGIYCCSKCGMPSGWTHPALRSQTLDDYCGSCGAKMDNPAKDNKTPREAVQACWIRNRERAHQYFCSVCGGKECAPREWCPRCGTRMYEEAWKKRISVREEWKREQNQN